MIDRVRLCMGTVPRLQELDTFREVATSSSIDWPAQQLGADKYSKHVRHAVDVCFGVFQSLTLQTMTN